MDVGHESISEICECSSKGKYVTLVGEDAPTSLAAENNDAEGFPPHKKCTESPVEVATVLGILRDDFHNSDCTSGEDPLRMLLNHSDAWVYRDIKPKQLVNFEKQLSEAELEIGEFWKALTFHVPCRIAPLIRHSTVESEKKNDIRPSFLGPLETLEEYGSSRGKEEARLRREGISPRHHSRAGKKCPLEIAQGNPTSLDIAQEVSVSPLCFTSVDYRDPIPTSEAVRHILRCTQKEARNQCVLLHLAAALAHSEIGHNRPHLPFSRDRLMA